MRKVSWAKMINIMHFLKFYEHQTFCLIFSIPTNFQLVICLKYLHDIPASLCVLNKFFYFSNDLWRDQSLKMIIFFLFRLTGSVWRFVPNKRIVPKCTRYSPNLWRVTEVDGNFPCNHWWELKQTIHQKESFRGFLLDL